MVTVVVAITIGHPPEAAIVFVIVYVPTVLPAILITPVLELILNPAGDAVNVPALPVNAGDGLLAF